MARQATRHSTPPHLAHCDLVYVTPERLDEAIQATSREVGGPPPLLIPPLEAGGPGTFSIRLESDLATLP